MGGGTGTGAAPVIADIARSLNILTVGVVTRPFQYEGEKRSKIADEGINEMRKFVDSLIVIPNEKLMTELDEDVSMRDAFAAADEVLRGAVSGITEVIKTPGLISLDFADVKTVMSGRGMAMMGSGSAKGQHRATEATEKAIYSPLLDDVSLDGARGVLVNISSAPGALKMREYHEIIGMIQEKIHPDADFKAGMAEIEDMDEEEIRVTVIATGLNDLQKAEAQILLREDNPVADNNVVNIDVAESVSANNQFANFNKNAFSTPAFFRKNRS
jgi:cell division protein FtsZ